MMTKSVTPTHTEHPPWESNFAAGTLWGLRTLWMAHSASPYISFHPQHACHFTLGIICREVTSMSPHIAECPLGGKNCPQLRTTAVEFGHQQLTCALPSGMQDSDI